MKIEELSKILDEFDGQTTVKTNGCQMCIHDIIGFEFHNNEVWLKIEE